MSDAKDISIKIIGAFFEDAASVDNKDFAVETLRMKGTFLLVTTQWASTNLQNKFT